MALLKAVKTNYGIDAIYWNIYTLNENFKTKYIDVTLAGYLSKEARDAKFDAVAWQNLQFAGDDYIQDATRKAVYEKLKTTDFIDAEDA